MSNCTKCEGSGIYEGVDCLGCGGVTCPTFADIISKIEESVSWFSSYPGVDFTIKPLSTYDPVKDNHFTVLDIVHRGALLNNLDWICRVVISTKYSEFLSIESIIASYTYSATNAFSLGMFNQGSANAFREYFTYDGKVRKK